MPIFGFVRRDFSVVHFEFEKTSNAHVDFSGLPLDVGRSALDVFFLAALIDCHVLVVLLQLLSVLGDLNGFRIEDPNRHVLTAKFNRTIRRRDPSFERGFSVIAEGHPHVSSFERLDGDSILFA